MFGEWRHGRVRQTDRHTGYELEKPAVIHSRGDRHHPPGAGSSLNTGLGDRVSVTDGEVFRNLTHPSSALAIQCRPRGSIGG